MLTRILKIVLVFINLISLFYSLNIDDFGAIAGNSSHNVSLINGRAFYDALIAANNGTDRTVLISYGKTYNMLPYGPIQNVINVTIQIDGTINTYITDVKQWPLSDSGSALNLIDLELCKGLIIRGNGTINGYGYIWWTEVILVGNDNRPNLIDISYANNTLIEGITLLDGPKYHMSLLNQLNLTVRYVTIHVNLTGDNITIPTFPLNTDGIDISGRYIYLTNLNITNYDDAVAVKPSRSSPDYYSNCTQDVLIENSYVKYGVGMSIGSVPPNENVNCVKNVTIRNIKFEKPLKAIYIKPNPGDDGTGYIGNIVYENIEINDAKWWAIFISTQQQHQPHSTGTDCSFFYPLPGTECIANPRVTVENITLRNVNIYNGLLSPGILQCNETNPCRNFLFDNVNVYNWSEFPIQQGYLCKNVIGQAVNSNLVPDCFPKKINQYIIP